MSETRWLSQDEQRAWRGLLESTRLLLDALDRQLTVESAMPVGYYEILVNLSEAPGRSARMGELARRTRSSRSRLSHAVDRLEERGWVSAASARPTDAVRRRRSPTPASPHWQQRHRVTSTRSGATSSIDSRPTRSDSSKR